MNNVTTLPAHERMSPQEALDYASNCLRENGCQEVVISGFYESGEFFVFSSGVTRKSGLWLSEQLRLHALGGDYEDL
jgi:hypothetical protein